MRRCYWERTAMGHILRKLLCWPRLSRLAILVAIACSPGMGRASYIGPQGGPGGGTFPPLQCPGGMYMLGVALHSGTLVDAIRANCLAYDPSIDQFVRPPQFTAFTGGPGGSLQQNGCPPERYVSAIKVGFTRNGSQPQYLDYVELSCTVLSGYGGDVKVCLHTGQGCWDSPGLSFTVPCPTGEAAVGLIGRSGVYVDAIGLVCAPKPVHTPPAGGGTGVQLTPNQTAILGAHNGYRQTCGAPALVWDPTLAANAQAWASGCHVNSQGGFCHQAETPDKCPGAPGNNPNGESTSFAYRTITQSGSSPHSVLPAQSPVDAVKSWYCEVSRFPFDSTSPSIDFGYTGSNCSGTATGHFTQVVWKSTMRVGCAMATCPAPGTSGIQGTLWVCEYAPAGNINTPQQVLANVSKTCARQP
jgi:cysteine-rich secretory family protein